MRESALRYDWLDGCLTTERIERSSKVSRANLREQSRVKRESSSKGRRAESKERASSRSSVRRATAQLRERESGQHIKVEQAAHAHTTITATPVATLGAAFDLSRSTKFWWWVDAQREIFRVREGLLEHDA